MSKDYYRQHEGSDKYAVYDGDEFVHRGKAEYAEDGHMTQYDNYSPVAGMPGYHHHEWWNERQGYGHEIHKDH